ncbi:hypothetical protein [Aeromicrobium terrae]|uniref:Uncharacterized protein n=1 Tax=Aeromicrobium terrae TaxID=2498846 RepID=A0A5C8NGE8_9ACTN|nr:hypothetical protein [Aeromicrobium terrae]TXL57618.1 hypothetical protein FHP06_12575 [Aeromicrobium terrae]
MSDAVVRRVRAELIELAVDQISKPIAHEFDIRIELAEDDGEADVVVEAASRSVRPVVTQILVSVRLDGDTIVVSRDGGAQRVEADLTEAEPDIATSFRHRLSDFVAGCIAAALSRLNAEMQRRLGGYGGS